MLSISGNNQAEVIETFDSTSRYLDDLLNIDNPYFEQVVTCYVRYIVPCTWNEVDLVQFA